MNVLVTGGAGYIGSHASIKLAESGHKLVVLDNLCSGHRWAVEKSAVFEYGDIGDSAFVNELLERHSISAVVHFAAHIEVEESTRHPLKYFKNNTLKTAKLIEACANRGVEKFVFSSTAATYGVPDVQPITETTPQNPINPYGLSKLMSEQVLKEVGKANNGFRFVVLRYFNVAGASMLGRIGQATPKPTHLIKIACQAATGKRDRIAIFGTDYSTSDGTCIRDYIHVDDLADAHVLALNYLDNGGESEIFNCGYGKGFSVKEVINCVKEVSGVDFEVVTADRRRGDPAELVANSNKLQRTLGWKPKLDDLSTICRSAYEWESHFRDIERF